MAGDAHFSGRSGAAGAVTPLTLIIIIRRNKRVENSETCVTLFSNEYRDSTGKIGCYVGTTDTK